MSNQAVKKTPERKCIGCSEKKAKNELIRIVRLPNEKGVELDRTGKKSGRGAYICKNAECFKKAQKQNSLSRAFQTPVSLEVYAELEKALNESNE